MRKESVLFASKNNKAVDVVYKKLSDILETENWILRLGNMEKIKECNDRILASLAYETNLDYGALLEETNSKIEHSDNNIKKLHALEQAINSCQESISKHEQTINTLKALFKYPQWLDSLSEIASPEIDVPQLIKQTSSDLWILQKLSHKNILIWLLNVFFGNILQTHFQNKIFKIVKDLPKPIKNKITSNLPNIFIEEFYELYKNIVNFLKIIEVQSKLVQEQKKLEGFPDSSKIFEKLSQEKIINQGFCQEKLKFTWGKSINAKRENIHARTRRHFNKITRNIPKNRQGWLKFMQELVEILDFFHIWIVTNLSARKSIPLEPAIFDLVVIDESSQCDILSALPLLFRAKRMVIIGDPKQLQHICLLNDKTEMLISKKHNVENFLTEWSYKNRSIYDLTASMLLEKGENPILLNEHYRCHPDIIGFSNKTIYKNKLMTKTNVTIFEKILQKERLGIFWHDVKGAVSPSPSGVWRQKEIDKIIELVKRMEQTLPKNSISIGIITPFRKQAEKNTNGHQANQRKQNLL